MKLTRLPSSSDRALMLADGVSSRAIALAELGQLTKALGTAERIVDPDVRQSTFRAISLVSTHGKLGRMAFSELQVPVS